MPPPACALRETFRLRLGGTRVFRVRTCRPRMRARLPKAAGAFVTGNPAHRTAHTQAAAVGDCVGWKAYNGGAENFRGAPGSPEALRDPPGPGGSALPDRRPRGGRAKPPPWHRPDGGPTAETGSAGQAASGASHALRLQAISPCGCRPDRPSRRHPVATDRPSAGLRGRTFRTARIPAPPARRTRIRP